MGPKTTPFFKRPLGWTFASAVALTKPRMGQCTALLIPASNGLKLSSAQGRKVTPRRWNAHFHTYFASLWWCPILSECRHWLNFVFGIYSLIWSDFSFCSCNYSGWSQHHIGSGGGRHYWYASYLGMRGCKKCQNQGVWCAEQHGSPCMSMFLAAIRHNVTRCHDMLHFLVLCWLKSRIMNHVATYFPSSKILKDMRREKVCAQAAANDNECLNMSQQFDCWIRVRWSEWMQFESALIFCAAPGRVTAIVYSWRIRNHTTEIAMNNTYFS